MVAQSSCEEVHSLNIPTIDLLLLIPDDKHLENIKHRFLTIVEIVGRGVLIEVGGVRKCPRDVFENLFCLWIILSLLMIHGLVQTVNLEEVLQLLESQIV